MNLPALPHFLLATSLHMSQNAKLLPDCFSLSPDAKDDLQQGANTGDEEDGADEVALR